ncbi:MAG: amidohydrolase [Verrucomicrobia bacterium]|nr:amidohydrolase [Verrucomicrobiota bacterium]MCG2681197.1 amidohydrolase [Kiritimatiellia bacterium]MBU4246779.1 amidohydrolase [Verrucomicrobiota bacterium]MBU4290587.1 amidohydrolase [Verrucomicrobiota bacterium]MBU4429728.1 amidohydrolase [Verrucomicrobiota bacterium]
MRLKFIDINLAFGQPVRAGYRPAFTAGDVRRVMKQAGIAKALVWHVAQHDLAPADGNRLLAKAIAGASSLWGCWTILPPQTDEVITPDFFRRMKRHGIVALRAFPDYHKFLINRVTFGRFLDEVTERRIPLLLSLEKGGITWPAVYQVMADFPKLTCILCDIGIWGVDRFTWPLLETYPNLYLETSLLALDDGGFESMVARFGARRMVFGTNFPERYPEAGMLSLIRADISRSDKQRIAAANWEVVLNQMRV